MGARVKTDAVPRKRCAVPGDGRRCGAHRKGPHPDLKSRRVSGHCRLLSLAHVGRSWEIQTKRCCLHVTLPVLLISISLQGFGLRSWFGMGAVELPAT